MYGFRRIEQSTSTLNIVSKFNGRVAHHFVPLIQALDRWGKTEGTFIFTQLVKELKSFIDLGIPVIEATNLEEWFFDPKSRRLYFMAPHWFASTFSKANQLGFGKFRDSHQILKKLKGESGMLAQAVIASLKMIALNLIPDSVK